MIKYKKFSDSDHEVKTFRWPYWLLPLLLLSLVLVLGLFIFITIHSTDSFGCFFHCGQQHTGQKIDDGGVYPPDIYDHLHNKTDAENRPKHAREDGVTKEKKMKPSEQQADEIKVHVNLTFPEGHVPSIPKGSHLKITLKDSSIQDVASVEIASTTIDSFNPTGNTLIYEWELKRPSNRYRFLAIDAVLNMGWKAHGDDWIRKGDYFVDTMTLVELQPTKKTYEVDIHLVKL